ncbi:hypothetical protein Vadar_017270 [Vaccinium darrowii]|uniref:Uncharacterized protein n=1 Tax=Vaccinium darrowii TaxID=229202 RepID=A0ACB7YFB1_9ERIC|nr:hypothetical protein Vadar_017270 [Vaccinium darrowii]
MLAIEINSRIYESASPLSTPKFHLRPKINQTLLSRRRTEPYNKHSHLLQRTENSDNDSDFRISDEQYQQNLAAVTAALGLAVTEVVDFINGKCSLNLKLTAAFGIPLIWCDAE